MVEYLPRSAWNARPANPGPGALVPDRVDGLAFHWPGTTSHTPITSQAAVASALRGWQNDHIDSRGWSDIAYQVAIDQAGRAWTLRGLVTQSGANGDRDVNERFGAVLLVLVQGEEPTDAMKATARAVVDDFRRLYPHGTKIVGHRDVRPEPTDCPGPAAYAALKAGDFTPGTQTTPEDEMTPAQMTELKNFIEARTQAYAIANNTYTRQVLSSTAKALIAADQASDKAQADRILAEFDQQAAQLAADTIAAVPAPEPES